MLENIIEIKEITRMLESKIQSDTLVAMKNSDKFKVSVLRMLKSAIQAEKINAKNELTDANIVTIIKKQVKQRTDSILEYEKYNRPDMVETLQAEIKILEEYLPKQLTSEETKEAVLRIMSNYPNATIKDMGKIMKEASSSLGSVADMSEVSKIIKNSLV